MFIFRGFFGILKVREDIRSAGNSFAEVEKCLLWIAYKDIPKYKVEQKWVQLHFFHSPTFLFQAYTPRSRETKIATEFQLHCPYVLRAPWTLLWAAKLYRHAFLARCKGKKKSFSKKGDGGKFRFDIKISKKGIVTRIAIATGFSSLCLRDRNAAYMYSIRRSARVNRERRNLKSDFGTFTR